MGYCVKIAMLLLVMWANKYLYLFESDRTIYVTLLTQNSKIQVPNLIIQPFISKFRVLNENIPVPSENVPVSSENVPVSSENVPVSSENVPVSSENIPVSSENVPVHRENHGVHKAIAFVLWWNHCVQRAIAYFY
jgi:hypothetical protein